MRATNLCVNVLYTLVVSLWKAMFFMPVKWTRAAAITNTWKIWWLWNLKANSVH